LELEGFVVHTASNGQDGLKITLSNLDSCAIILDIQMPIMNGWEYLKAYNQVSKSNPPPTVIIISAFSDAAEKAKKEAIPYFKKPVDIDKLVAKLQACCS